MNLDEALTMIAADIGLDADELIAYAAEDNIGGYHADESLSRWPIGSLWEVDGQVLYALVRALRPASIVEMGAHRGASTAHIAAALKANGTGELYSVDILESTGDLLPDEYRDVVTFVYKDAVEYLNSTRRKFDMAFEDMMHTAEQVLAVCGELKTRVRPGGLVLHHDSEHFVVGSEVRAGLEASGVAYRSVLIAPADTGLAWWRMPE
jgi:predicted O-methyltransferase YrrM